MSKLPTNNGGYTTLQRADDIAATAVITTWYKPFDIDYLRKHMFKSHFHWNVWDENTKEIRCATDQEIEKLENDYMEDLNENN